MKITYGLSVQPISAVLAEELISLSAEVFGSVDRTDELWRFENMPDLTGFIAVGTKRTESDSRIIYRKRLRLR